jgi:flagellar biogenesis protein FliO
MWLIVFACVAMLGTDGYGEDELPRGGPRTSTSGVQLPPRSNGHEATAVSPRKSTPSGGGVWTTVISLAAIVGCLALVAYWLRPYLGVSRGLPIEALELLGRRTIEQKIAIHLIRCGGKVLVVGVSPDGARTLSEITDPAEVQRLVDTCHSPRDARPISPPSIANAGGYDQRPVARGTAPSTAPAVEQQTLAQRVSLFQAGESRRAS